MGQITITLEGSFPKKHGNTHQESALEGGHAAAIARSIEFLIKMMPDAISLDHELHSKGDGPPNADFGRSRSSI